MARDVSRRALLAGLASAAPLAAAPLAGAPLATPSARPAGGVVFVLNSADATVSLLEAEGGAEIRRIPVLRQPHHLAPTPDGSSIAVGDSDANELLFLDPATGGIQRRERISNPYHLAFSPDSRTLAIPSLRRGQIDLYDAATLELRNRLGGLGKPSHPAFSPDSRVAYVTLQASRGLIAIDTETGEPLWTMEVGPEPAGVLWNRGRLVVGVMGAGHFAVVDPQERKIERTIPVGRGAHAIFAAPGGGMLYGTSRVDSRITAIDPYTYAVRDAWAIPGGPDCITFDAAGRVWASLRWIGRVAVLDPETSEVETVRVGRSPHGILFQPGRA